jgi:hypothetical protein
MIHTFPRFRSSNLVLKSENSLGLPYMLIKHGPNVGKNPSAPKSDIELIGI